MTVIDEIERRIAELPVGYISKKTIRGKVAHYLQWKEGGKLRSKYIKKGELDEIAAKIDERRALQARLKEIRVDGDAHVSALTDPLRTSAIIGDALIAFAEPARGWERRDCFEALSRFLKAPHGDRVCLLYGLRRTGKTTMLRQALLDMTPDDLARTAYIKATSRDTVADVNYDLRELWANGVRTVMIDEATLMGDFIDGAALFSDVWAAQGMKIVLSGTDSLGFWFAERQELYDRALTIHTTFIPFREHSRLLGIDDIDEYIRYGGTLRAGEIDLELGGIDAEAASFRDDESTRRYIDTAICRNIQHSLACCEDGGHFRHLRELYDVGELTGAINRIVEDMNHRFVLSVLTRDFVSHDLKISARNLRSSRDANDRSDVLDAIDTVEVTQGLMRVLEIRDASEQTVAPSGAHIAEIKEYLAALDLIVDCPIETALDAEPIEHTLFAAPGMRYSQARSLVCSLMKDRTFAAQSEREKRRITERILEEVRGRMMGEIVLLETSRALPKHKRAFKLQFAAGEFDMVIYDAERDTCEIFEIKHSRERTPEQYRHLIDRQKCAQTERRFGEIVGRYVIYRGDDAKAGADGVAYINVEGYLKGLRNGSSRS